MKQFPSPTHIPLKNGSSIFIEPQLDQLRILKLTM